LRAIAWDADLSQANFQYFGKVERNSWQTKDQLVQYWSLYEMIAIDDAHFLLMIKACAG
jgi:hypothetical protein